MECAPCASTTRLAAASTGTHTTMLELRESWHQLTRAVLRVKGIGRDLSGTAGLDEVGCTQKVGSKSLMVCAACDRAPDRVFNRVSPYA